jgi:cation-transporting P-type ATPase 13A2
MISMNFLTSSINYVLIRTSYKNIKEIAEKKHFVAVLREGTWKNIENSEFVPGDLYRPSETIACDSVVLREDLFVSEVGFTGESTPVGKFSLAEARSVYEGEHWAYEGSEVVSMKARCLLLAVSTGYSTRKGRIIRKILHPKPADNDLFRNIVQQSAFLLVVMLGAYLAFFHVMFDGVENRSLVYILLGSFIIQSLPAALPIFINAAYTIILLRLRSNNVMGLKSEKTI